MSLKLEAFFVVPREWMGDRMKDTADRAVRVFELLRDDLGLARAWGLSAQPAWNENRYDEAARQFARALVHARRTGNEREELIALNAFLQAMYFGSAHVTQVRPEIESFLGRVGEISGEGFRAVLTLAGLSAMEGKAEESRQLFNRAKSIGKQMGLAWAPATLGLFAEEVGLLLGDAAFAERELRAGYEFLESIGERGIRSTTATHLAEALHQLGRDAEAERFADLSLELASTDDIASQARGRAVKARLLAARGNHVAAQNLAREAVELSEQTDDLYMHGQVLIALAEILRIAGRNDEAIPVLDAAVEVSERKGNAVTAGRARSQLADLQAGSRV